MTAFLLDILSFKSSIMKSAFANCSRISFLPDGVLFENLCGSPCPNIITEVNKVLVKSGNSSCRIFSESLRPLPDISLLFLYILSVDLYTSLRKEFSGDVEKLLKAIFYASINPAEWFATRVRDAIQGAGTKDKQLIRIIVSRAEIDLREIKQAYYRLYNRDMVSDVRDDTSGDYRKLLTQILTKC